MKSGFEINPIGYTGFICADRNPATKDCFWQCRITDATDETFEVELEDGRIGRIKRTDFTPMAMIVKENA